MNSLSKKDEKKTIKRKIEEGGKEGRKFSQNVDWDSHDGSRLIIWKVSKSDNTMGKGWSGSAFTIAIPEAYIFMSLSRTCHDLFLILSYYNVYLFLSYHNVYLFLSYHNVHRFLLYYNVYLFLFRLCHENSVVICPYFQNVIIYLTRFVHSFIEVEVHWMVHFRPSILLSWKLVLLFEGKRFPLRKQRSFSGEQFLWASSLWRRCRKRFQGCLLCSCSMELSCNFSYVLFYMNLIEAKLISTPLFH